jgi:DNA-binding transcriptional LysR family regulator
VSEVIERRLKQAAIALAEAQDYGRAAARLEITVSDLQHLVDELESKLCLHVFTPGAQPPSLTKDGDFLIRAFREALAQHDQI